MGNLHPKFAHFAGAMARRSTIIALGAVVLIFMFFTAFPSHSNLQSIPAISRLRGGDHASGPTSGQVSIPDAKENKADSAPKSGSEEIEEKFAHQGPVEFAKDPISDRQCKVIKESSLQDIVDGLVSDGGSEPVIYHFHGGKIVDEKSHAFRASDEFCSIVFVPQGPHINASHYKNLPIKGLGPDSIHIEISSEDVRFIPPHPDFAGFYSGSPKTGSNTPDSPLDYAAYTIPYVLNQPGTYESTAEVEFTNYDWVMEDPINLAEEALTYEMLNTTVVSKSPALKIAGQPVSRPKVQCYHKNNREYRGRWYRAEAFKRGGNQTLLNPAAHLEFAEHNTTVDEWGWTFAPDHCNMQYFSPEDHLSCLADRTIQCLGDSNSRRTFKSIMGGGVAWCQDPKERICQCEDHYQTTFQDALFNEINATKFRDALDRDDPTVFGRNSSIYFDYVGGLLNQKLFNAWFFFYDYSPNSPSIIAKRVSRNGPIDVVHVSFLGWDMAAIKTTDEVLAELPKFRAKLFAAYPPGTRFVTRLANSNCCGNINHRVRYSPPRFRVWNAMWRDFWRKDEEKGLVRVIDPTVLQGRMDAETAFFCPTTHLRTSHVRLEQMMWMSAVCEKTPDGTKMRNWDKAAWKGLQKAVS